MVASSIFELPAEIRDLIFEYVLTCDKTVVTFCLDSYQSDSYTQAVQPALTRVSRRIRDESLPIYYACNTFVLHTEPAKAKKAHQWLSHNRAHLGMLRRLSFWVPYIPTANDRGSPMGAISVSVMRPKRQNPWVVDDLWNWITVLRKPAELNRDVKFIRENLAHLAPTISEQSADGDVYIALISNLRQLYMQTKSS